MKNKSTKEGTMNKKQIRRYALFLVKKTLGSYHFEENLLDGFFSERQVKKHEKKIYSLKGKDWDYFTDEGLEYAFDKYEKADLKKVSLKQLNALQSNPTFKVFNNYITKEVKQ